MYNLIYNQNFRRIAVIVVMICMGFIFSASYGLASPTEELKKVGTGMNITAPKPMPEVIGQIINIILTISGIIMVILVVWGGFQWMTAGGNEDQVKKAKQLLINAVMGLAITLSAYAIAYFAVEQLDKATTT